MELVEKIEKYLAQPERKVEDAFDLLKELIDKKLMGPRTAGLIRRAGRNPHKKFIPHFDRELVRFLKLRKPIVTMPAFAAEAAKTEATKLAKKEEFIAGPVTKTFTDEEYAALPENVQAFSNENIKLQRLRDKARHGLELTENDEVRKELAESIATMQKQIDSNFAALEYYKTNGQLPEANAEQPGELTLAQAKDELNNARSRRSKAKTALKSAKTKPTQEKYEAKVAEEEANVLRLESLVNELEQDESLQGSEEGK